MPMDWKDGKTHRDPIFPVGGYAPGNYMGTCLSCDGTFTNMDKRASECFPCAIEGLQAKAKAGATYSHNLRGIVDAAQQVLAAADDLTPTS